MRAAEQAGIEIIRIVDTPRPLAEQWQMAHGIDFNDLETAVPHLVAYARRKPVAAVLAIDDSGALLSARVSAALGLPHNDPAAAGAARNKYLMRRLLATAEIPSPPFRHFPLETTVAEVAAAVQSGIGYPCVVKPVSLNGSRGVIRVDDAAQLAAALQRLRGILQGSAYAAEFLVEGYIPGVEVALEAVLQEGELLPLALFDKPDPLEGPFFEETIYVTPSRLAEPVQQEIIRTTAVAARAIGLQRGSVHAELRINDEGAWIVEVNGRSIGGLCSQTLRFELTIPDERGEQRPLSLEELLLRQACGLEIGRLQREARASGVMMIPIPRRGILRKVSGVDEAASMAYIDEVTITAPLHNRLVPLPEGESYLGFIFASAASSPAVEAALRKAHQKLSLEIDEEIALQLR